MTAPTPAWPARGHVHLDAVGGAAGDMFVAALLDALPDLRQRVFEDLAAVLPEGIGRPELTAGLSAALAVPVCSRAASMRAARSTKRVPCACWPALPAGSGKPWPCA